jgi:hypothetical protein
MSMDPNHERRALLALLDAVEALAFGLQAGVMPSPEEVLDMCETFERHRRELAGEVVAWPQDPA